MPPPRLSMSIPFHSRRKEVAVNESATSAGAGGIPISADNEHRWISVSLLRRDRIFDHEDHM